ncbi:MAG: antibiotic biosynthesis monooxygenase [Pseudomonadota bacterium]
MAGMFMTMTRAHVKAGNEMAARKLLEDQLLPNDGKKPSEVVDGLIGFGLMKSKSDPSMYGIVSVWQSEADFEKLSSNPHASGANGLVQKLRDLCEGDVKGEGFYIESL